MNIKTNTPIFKTQKKSRVAVIFAILFILLGVLLVFLEVRGDRNLYRICAYVFLISGACYWIFPVKTSSQILIRQLISLFLLGALFASCLFALLTIIGRGRELGAPQHVLLILKILTAVFIILTLIGGAIVGIRIYKKIFK